MILRLRASTALLVAVLSCSSCGGSSSPPLEAAVSVVAAEEVSDSLGFDVGRHGWAFGNYAAVGSGLFGVADAVALFGDSAVCVEDEGACTPTPAATEWIDMVASSMQYGVCEGMTVASVDRFLVSADPVTGLLALDGTIERQLARLFATQFLDDVISATERWRDQSVSQIVAELQASLGDPSAEQYTLGVYSSIGGHSVLPHAVDVDAAGRGVIYVYDPNWPGEQRYIEVDTAADRWRFSYFSADQADDPEAWTGGNGTMDLTPLSVREAPFPQPFKGSGTGAKQLLAVSSSSRNWTLTSADGATLDGESVVPGRDGVVAITRGAPLDKGSQRTDVVLVEWTETAELTVENGAAKLSLFTDAGAGSVVVSDEATIKVEVPPNPGEEQSGLEIQVEVAEKTEAVVTVASATERVQVVAEADLTTSVLLAERSTKIEVTDDQGEEVTVVEIIRSKTRTDVIVDADGEINTVVPKSIDAVERLEAVEESKDLLVGDNVEFRTVEVTKVDLEKIEIQDLQITPLKKVESTTTTPTKTVVVKGDEINEKDVEDIQISDSGKSGTLLLSDGSKVEVRITPSGDLVASDGRAVDITIKPDTSRPTKEKEVAKSDDSLEKKDLTGDKEITDGKEKAATDSDKKAVQRKKEEATVNEKEVERKKEAATDSDKQAIEPNEDKVKLGDSTKSSTDDTPSGFKLDDSKR